MSAAMKARVLGVGSATLLIQNHMSPKSARRLTAVFCWRPTCDGGLHSDERNRPPPQMGRFRARLRMEPGTNVLPLPRNSARRNKCDCFRGRRHCPCPIGSPKINHWIRKRVGGVLEINLTYYRTLLGNSLLRGDSVNTNASYQEAKPQNNL